MAPNGNSSLYFRYNKMRKARKFWAKVKESWNDKLSWANTWLEQWRHNTNTLTSLENAPRSPHSWRCLTHRIACFCQHKHWKTYSLGHVNTTAHILSRHEQLLSWLRGHAKWSKRDPATKGNDLWHLEIKWKYIFDLSLTRYILTTLTSAKDTKTLFECILIRHWK